MQNNTACEVTSNQLYCLILAHYVCVDSHSFSFLCTLCRTGNVVVNGTGQELICLCLYCIFMSVT